MCGSPIRAAWRSPIKTSVSSIARWITKTNRTRTSSALGNGKFTVTLKPAQNRFRLTQSMGDVLAYSAGMRRLAVELGKVASDLRLLSMGPRAGISEIALPAVQPGSSIMPGKVNPSIPEMVNQVCFQVIGCDVTVCVAAEAGQLELNVMMPVIAWNAVHATRILTNAMRVLQVRCVADLQIKVSEQIAAAPVEAEKNQPPARQAEKAVEKPVAEKPGKDKTVPEKAAPEKTPPEKSAEPTAAAGKPAEKPATSTQEGLANPGAGAEAAETGPRMVIRMIFEQDSWVEIKDRNGNTVFGQLNAAGSRRSASGEPPLSIVVGNAAGVRLFQGEKSVDLAPHTRVDVARLILE